MVRDTLLSVCFLLSALSSEAALPSLSALRLQGVSQKVPAGILPKHTNVTMRDGVKLHTQYWVPSVLPGQKFSVVLDRSPYGAHGMEEIANAWIADGFAVVGQDQRGTEQSGGYWEYWHTDADDAYDTISWIVAQSWSNGKVFNSGISADCMLEYSQGLRLHPAVKGGWCALGTASAHQTVYQNGAYRQSLISDWLHGIQKHRHNHTDYPSTILKHEALDKWWLDISPSKETWSRVDIPMVHQAGWYDIFLSWNIEAFNELQENGGDGARGKQMIIIGPMGHCWLMWNRTDWFFEGGVDGWPWATLLAGKQWRGLNHTDPFLPDLKAVTLYIMGPGYKVGRAPPNRYGMYWTTLDTWPTTTPLEWFLTSEQRLSEDNDSNQANMTYRYDPRDPVPSVGGDNLFLHCGPLMQDTTEHRDDVLLFTSPPAQKPLAFVGSVVANLFVSSDRNDTDFTVKLTDVYEDGHSYLLRNDIIRMKWRDNPSIPSPMRNGEIYHVQIKIWETAYILNEGHRLRLAVSSSNSPHFSVNNNTGLPINVEAEPLIAHNTLHIGGATPSSIILPTVQLDDIPRNVNPI